MGQKDYAVTVTPLPLLDLEAVALDWPDEVVDLTDRRRLFVLAVLGVEVTAHQAEDLFACGRPAAAGER